MALTVGDVVSPTAWLIRAFRENLAHSLAIFLFMARLADVLSTRMATPNLRLEANPLVRRLGWPFAWATTGVCFIAYVPDTGPAVAVIAIVMSLLVAAGNVQRAWGMRALGEDAYAEHARRIIAAARPLDVYASITASSLLAGAVGALLLLLDPDPGSGGHHVALGILCYAGATWFYSILWARRMIKEVGSSRRSVSDLSLTGRERGG